VLELSERQAVRTGGTSRRERRRRQRALRERDRRSAKLAELHGVNPHRALWLTAANPLFLTNFIASVHNDSLMIGLALAGLYYCATRRVILGIGAGAIWDMITKLGVPRLDGGAAVRAMAEAITLVRALSGGGDPVTFDGEFYHVDGLDPAAAPAPRVFTGSVGPKSLAATGQLADGWIPPGGSDWLSELYRESFHLTDIVQQLPPVFEHYWGNPAHTTCRKCGRKHAKP